jgi:HEAT repeat protein
MGGTPIMVGGVVVRNIRENYPEIAEQLNRELLDLLDDTHDSAQVSTLLLALGNSRMEENAGVIGGYVSDPDPGVRETAIRMAGRYPGEESTLALQEQLLLEDEPAIQACILRSLSSQPLAAGDLETVRSTLETALDEGVRSAAIETLAIHKHLDPDAVNAALQNAYHQETSRKTIKQIIQAFHRPVSKL